MDIRDWTKERKKELKLALKYWRQFIIDAFFYSVSGWIWTLGIGAIATGFSIGITYKKQGSIDMSNFLPPNFGWGVLIVLGLIFFYQLIIDVARKIEEYRIKANKYTWDDVSISIIPRKPDSVLMAVLEVVNNKPYDIESLRVELQSIQQDRYIQPIGKSVKNLCWSLDSITWDDIDIPKEKMAKLAIAGWLSRKINPIIMTGKMNENGERKSDYIKMETDSTYKVKLKWFGKIDGVDMDKYEKTYRLRYSNDDMEFEEILK